MDTPPLSHSGRPSGLSAGCSALAWETLDGRHLWGRNFDHNQAEADCQVTCLPRSLPFHTCAGRAGAAPPSAARFQSRYAAAGVGTLALGPAAPILYEGVNEAGLAGGQLYFRELARYPDAARPGTAPVQPPFLVTYCLALCSGVEEVVRALRERVCLVGTPVLGAVPPLHWMFSDRSGESIVVECCRTGLHIHRRTAGVMTNSPDYPWHLANLLNYPQLRPLDRGGVSCGGERLSPCFSGSGAAGLPGDWSSPSRFVRLAFLRQHAVKGADEEEGVPLLFRLLHSAAFPLGAVQLWDTDGQDAPPYDYTLYTSVSCAESGRFYWQTYRNPQIRCVELSRLSGAGRPLQFPLEESMPPRDLTGHPLPPAAGAL